MSARLEFDTKAFLIRYKPITERRQAALDVQVLKDSTYFIPKDEGTLEASGIIASGGGKMEWNTPYARKQYYELPNKSHDTNPNARMKWFEVAKANFLQVWLKIAGAKQ